ncbi:putative bifunctional diguanylate cyclase/phosphodiesterase [Protofrankia symbiont of Coriaria ruscifolia]|uniref:putative bifunctional diguanylate cyclase/phosphodiesterase n=1 Tax=Protofrankia symbiont of Coriaria ruscifolia TaxID=1306542 RepID=UPI001041AF08|nr:EAL domain-containing protein [Protofrankia symbiont of Coriaria ruscifolia]
MAVGTCARFIPSRYLLVLVVVTCTATAVTASCLSRLLDAPEPVSWWRLALGIACIAIGPIPLLRVRSGHHTGDYDLSEAGVVIGLALLPAPQLITISAAAVPIMHAVLRRSPVKVLFNGASATIGTAVAAGVLWLLGGRAGHLEGAAIALAAPAGLTVCLWTSLSVSMVISAVRGMPLRRTLRETMGISTVIAAGGIAVGCGAVALAYTSPVTLIVLPPILVGLVMVYRMQVDSAQQRDRWRQLNAAAKDLAILDRTAIEARATEIAYEIFRPDGVELVVTPVVTPVAASVPTTPAQPTGCPRGADDVATTLTGPSGQVGVLRLHFARPAPWREHDQAVLAAFANLVALAVTNASTYAEAHDQAFHDALTDLGNRRMLQQRTAQAIATTAAGPRFALLLVDLDRFRDVNDTLGHDAGDQLLRGIAERLRRSVRAGDLVTRIGGDEFAVLLTGIRDAEAAETIASALTRMLARPVSVEGMMLSVEASVGIACLPEDGETVDELLRRADVAMYQAKRTHSGYRRYRADEDSSTLAHMALMADLHGALDQGDISLCYQPQIDLETGRIVAFEALARWNHPVLGLLAPDAFIGAVEQSGRIGDFTRAVLREALSASGRWRADGARVGISVNLFARNLLEPDLATEIAQLLLANRMPASALTLEITERAVVMESATTVRSLAALHDLGVRLAVDDFGTGYCALNVLGQFDLHEVKIDQSFVRNLSGDRANSAIVRATIALAHDLGLRVVAEGVEDSETISALSVLGCDLAQGAFISPPGSAEQATALLRDTGRLATPRSADVLPFRRPAGERRGTAAHARRAHPATDGR